MRSSPTLRSMLTETLWTIRFPCRACRLATMTGSSARTTHTVRRQLERRDHRVAAGLDDGAAFALVRSTAPRTAKTSAKAAAPRRRRRRRPSAAPGTGVVVPGGGGQLVQQLGQAAADGLRARHLHDPLERLVVELDARGCAAACGRASRRRRSRRTPRARGRRCRTATWPPRPDRGRSASRRPARRRRSPRSGRPRPPRWPCGAGSTASSARRAGGRARRTRPAPAGWPPAARRRSAPS